MRMWMVDPGIMCRSHLLGEHNEIHMIVGAIRLKRRLDRFFENNCLEIRAIRRRHQELVNEMRRRGYRHQSPLPNYSATYLGKHQTITIEAGSARLELMSRCRDCFARAGGQP